MFKQLIELDRSLFLTINGLHTPFFDKVMVIFSASAPWIPLYIAIALAMFFSFKWEVSDSFSKPKFLVLRKSLYFGLIAMAGAIITFAFTDILSTQIKHLIERPRPAFDVEIGNLARMLEHKGGQYGFISSHAANVFGLATFTSSIFKKKYYTVTIYFWAVMVSYSRIYVGKHFPLDVLGGALFGTLIGLGIFLLVNSLFKRFNLMPGKSDVLHN